MTPICGKATVDGTPCRNPPGCAVNHPPRVPLTGAPPSGTPPVAGADPLRDGPSTGVSPEAAGITRGALGADAVDLTGPDSPLGRVEAPIPEHVEVLTDDRGWIVSDRVAVYWEDLGEGLGGDYDPDDPADEPLLRFALEVRHADSGEWVQQWSDGYCTSVNADADEQTRASGLAHIARIVSDAASAGHGTSGAAANASWITTEQAAAAADRFAAADPDADAGLLDRLAGHPDPEVRAAVAANPNASPAARSHVGLIAD